MHGGRLAIQEILQDYTVLVLIDVTRERERDGSEVADAIPLFRPCMGECQQCTTTTPARLEHYPIQSQKQPAFMWSPAFTQLSPFHSAHEPNQKTIRRTAQHAHEYITGPSRNDGSNTDQRQHLHRGWDRQDAERGAGGTCCLPIMQARVHCLLLLFVAHTVAIPLDLSRQPAVPVPTDRRRLSPDASPKKKARCPSQFPPGPGPLLWSGPTPHHGRCSNQKKKMGLQIGQNRFVFFFGNLDSYH